MKKLRIDFYLPPPEYNKKRDEVTDMERLILKKLLEWKGAPHRKPLILKGVLQVGKTWILKELRRGFHHSAGQ